MLKNAMAMAGLAVLVALGLAQAQPLSVTNGTLVLTYETATGAIGLADTAEGPLLADGALTRRTGATWQPIDAKRAEARRVRENAREELLIDLRGKAWLRAWLADDATAVIRTQGRVGDVVAWTARARLGARTQPGFLVGQQADDRRVLVTTSGPAAVPGARSIFDPERDLALTIASPGTATWAPGAAWTVSAEAPGDGELLTVTVQRHYYRDRLGIRHYAPMPRPARWPVAPVVAMTWYAIEGNKGRPAQTKERLYPNIDWVAEHLLPYAGELVFQFDDNYAQDDDAYMRALSDYVRAKGLVPGVWLAPYVVAPAATTNEHPEWFLRDGQGRLAVAFGGQSYGWFPKNNCRSGVLDPCQPAAMDAWYKPWWHKVSETWNYDFIKADGLTEALEAFRRSTNGGGVVGYRQALRLARDIVGPDKFINASWGVPPPVEAIGLVNGSRTGGDTGHAGHAAGVIVRWNFLNNICWWSDPDASANLYKAPVELARLNAQARVLTGQQFITDDRWTEVPPATRRVWQQSFPNLDIRPANLYEIRGDNAYDLFDLRVARPWGNWDVVGLFNYGREAATRDLALARLPLEAAQVHVYEFWTSRYVGLFARGATLPRKLKGMDAEVFAVVPARDDRPVLLSTSRHLTQGALELLDVQWQPDAAGAGGVVSGVSARLVQGDPYELVFVAGRWQPPVVLAPAGGAVRPDGQVVRVRFTPAQSGSVAWSLRFAGAPPSAAPAARPAGPRG